MTDSNVGFGGPLRGDVDEEGAERGGGQGSTPPERFTRGGSGDSAGPVTPVEGPDGLLWLCREDEEGQQSICIPWFQELRVPPGSLAGGAGPNAGPVIPVEGPDGLLWLCREDEEGQQSICIPWFQEVKVPWFGIFDPRDTRPGGSTERASIELEESPSELLDL